MTERSTTTLQRALTRLEAIDPVAAGDARSALTWLLGSDVDADVVPRESTDAVASGPRSSPLDVMNRFMLQQFCWYELPFKWIVSPQVCVEIVRALGRFFDLASMPRYGDLCRSQTTMDVLAAWALDARQGFAAFRKAMDASGLEPPSIDGFRWSSIMDPEEFAAFWSTAMALELAVDAGVIEPGTPGWRARQAEIVRAHLEQPRDERLGESLLQAVVSERLVLWIERGGGPKGQDTHSVARQQMLAPFTNALLAEPRTPRGLARSLASCSWLLGRIDEGVVLTATGRLPRALLSDAIEAHPRWWKDPDRQPRTEDDLPPLRALHRVLADAALTRRRGRHLVLTDDGRRSLGDAEHLWRSLTDALLGHHDFVASAREVMLAGLLLEPLVDPAELSRETLVVLTECGWQRGHSGEPVDPTRVVAVLTDAELLLHELGVVRSRGRGASRRVRLTATGRATALAALRARALAPPRR